MRILSLVGRDGRKGNARFARFLVAMEMATVGLFFAENLLGE
jgi:hypothetical protein